MYWDIRRFVTSDFLWKGWIIVKKLLALFLVGAVLAISVIGCGSSTTKATGTGATTAPAPTAKQP